MPLAKYNEKKSRVKKRERRQTRDVALPANYVGFVRNSQGIGAMSSNYPLIECASVQRPGRKQRAASANFFRRQMLAW